MLSNIVVFFFVYKKETNQLEKLQNKEKVTCYINFTTQDNGLFQ